MTLFSGMCTGAAEGGSPAEGVAVLTMDCLNEEAEESKASQLSHMRIYREEYNTLGLHSYNWPQKLFFLLRENDVW